MLYDCRTRKVSPDHPTIEGLTGMVGWARLAKILQEAGEVSASEELLALEITEYGIQLRLGRKES